MDDMDKVIRRLETGSLRGRKRKKWKNRSRVIDHPTKSEGDAQMEYEWSQIKMGLPP